jgi:CheY-like chemotaxis protein
MKRILIIDDALDVARLLRSAILTIDPNLQVAVVPSGEEALLEVIHGKPDLVIADVNLPGISGLDLINKLIKKFSGLCIIVMTGSLDPEVEKQAKELQVEAFLHKPMEINVFIETVQKALGLSGEALTSQTELIRQVEAPQPDEPVRLSEILSRLCTQINARAVVLLNEHAHIAALSGSLPGLDFETAWAPALVTAATAGYRVSRLTGGETCQQMNFWKGERWIIILISVGVFTLAVIHSVEKGTASISNSFDLLLSAQQDLEISLGRVGVRTTVPGTDLAVDEILRKVASSHALQPFGTDEDLQQLKNFQELFDKKKSELKKQDADEFWDRQEPLSPAGSVSTSDDLSYDQARKLGLVPDEDKE